MFQWDVRSIHPGGPIELFFISDSVSQLGNKGPGLCYPVCKMMHIKDPLLIVEMSNL